ncbi:hypothetical protein, partial [Neisseria sicca]|uniref:hypothetical protein n=1 Tax=Neisseria sicca TaxID=490 RepID=UPI001C99F76A
GFLFEVPLGCFLGEELGEIVGMDTEQLGKWLFEEISEWGGGNLWEKGGSGFEQLGVRFVGIEIEVV